MEEDQVNITLAEGEENELSIMVSLAERMIDDGGYQEVIEPALQSSDPGQVIGQFLVQLGAQLGESLPFDISPRIMLAEGGWVEQVSDFLQEEYGVPKKIMDRAEIYVGTSAQQIAQGQEASAQQPAEMAPSAPAQGIPLDGGMQ